jgi:uncharacterized protein
MDVIVVRLYPQQDLKLELQQLAHDRQIEAACILTGVGSLTQASLRFAGQSTSTDLNGLYEIVSLAGTLSQAGCHFHLSIADEMGAMIGGHLMPGCIIRTTAEIVIGLLPSYQFRREQDVSTGYLELVAEFQDS